ncbi:peptidyl-tRNA hydrolase Pth2 [Candidatus Poseidoniales archaeon]|nr:peptidyl-tRNA hydrolase Pth2 [Candidatus Poseidoniales archaeon]MDB2542142.1 peptidyl-tRNA hydrolase Pth2 [Candidatus Poseidoniales archaeon]MDC3316770.1 peptidyl-tRNA hydrolase Pth2 [Candidatus Poseidoniaceae archaeon]
MGLRSFIHRLTAPKPLRSLSLDEKLKMVFVVNHELKMGKGKIAAQVAHAAVKATLACGERDPALLDAWFKTGQKKICVKGDSAKHLEQLSIDAKKNGLLANKIHDAGHTQIPAGSFTVLALGPCRDEDVETITGDLKLL